MRLKVFFIFSILLTTPLAFSLPFPNYYVSWGSFAELEKSAREEDPNAMGELGMFYLDTQDYERALELCQKGAQKGNAYSLYCLGWTHYEGKAVAQDTAKARKWFNKAARKGSLEAQLWLGKQFLKDKNPKQAFNWFKKGAKRGDAQAQYELGRLYEKGDGVKHDADKALDYYLLAADKNHEQAQYRAGLAYLNGTGAKANPAMAMDWFAKASQADYPPALYQLGLGYFEGNGIAQDKAHGLKLISQAALLGDSNALSFRSN